MQKKIKNYLLPALFATIMLSPGFKILSALPPFRIEDFIILFVFLFTILGLTNRVLIKTPLSPITIIIYLLFLSMLLSIGMSEIVYKIPITMRDLFIIPQLIKYLLIFLLAKSLDLDEKLTKYFAYGILIIAIIMALISFCQNYNLLGVNSWLTPIYEDNESKIMALSQGHYWARVSGTAINPNYFGYLLVCVIGCILGFILHKPGDKLGISILPILGFVIISSLFTLSRTVIVSSFILVLILLFICFKYQRKGIAKITIILFFVGVICASFLIFFKTGGIEYRYSMDNVMRTHATYKGRIRDLVNPLKKVFSSVPMFIVGQGPSKSKLRTDSHNGYTWFLQRFGMVGLVLYISLIIFPLRRAIKLYHFSNIWWQKFLSISCILVISNWAVNEMAGNIFKDIQLMSLNVLFVGIPYGKWGYRLLENYNLKSHENGGKKSCAYR